MRTVIYTRTDKGNLVELKDVKLYCIHRKNKVRKVDCSSCTGKVSLFVFSCVIHKECLLSSQKSPGVMNCDRCRDRKTT